MQAGRRTCLPRPATRNGHGAGGTAMEPFMLFEPDFTRKAPFHNRRHYRVLKNFAPLHDKPFHAGDVLEYRHSGHSIYDGMDGYFFIEEAPTRPWRRWDISTCDDLDIWPTLFELLPKRRSWWIAWWTSSILLALAVILLPALAVGLAWALARVLPL